jgi:hypothetical protein
MPKKPPHRRQPATREPRPPPTNTKAIVSYMHCRLCATAPDGPQPSDIEVGWTPLGLQVWCRRHDANMVHIDFQGQQHPANVTVSRG